MFAVQAIVLAPLLLAPAPAESLGGYFIAAPFVIIGLTALNLPAVAAAFRRFRLPLATRRNHALEHATIIILRASGKKRVGGRASETGFRIHGRVTEREIEDAFAQVCRAVRAGRPLEYVSPCCGSNIVTALGGATSLLLLMAIATLTVNPPLAVRIGGFAGAVILFFGLRRRLGNALQRRFFMATDFADVSLRGIRREKPDPVWGSQLYFVKTAVRVATESLEPVPGRNRDESQVAGR